MNLREGTRRLALLLGVVGVLLGGFASYVELQSTIGQRAAHNRFEQLANSIMQRNHELLQTTPPGSLIFRQQDISPIPPSGATQSSEVPDTTGDITDNGRHHGHRE